MYCNYRPQRSCGKVHSVHGGVWQTPPGRHPLGRSPLDRHLRPGQTPPGQTPPPPGRHLPSLADTPPHQQTPLPPQQMATAADGTHPTGMHSCIKVKVIQGHHNCQGHDHKLCRSLVSWFDKAHLWWINENSMLCITCFLHYPMTRFDFVRLKMLVYTLELTKVTFVTSPCHCEFAMKEWEGAWDFSTIMCHRLSDTTGISPTFWSLFSISSVSNC